METKETCSTNERILHIATDEKFVNNAHWLFETIFPEHVADYRLMKKRGYILCEK